MNIPCKQKYRIKDGLASHPAKPRTGVREWPEKKNKKARRGKTSGYKYGDK
jgi:hypothetical protein